MTGHRWVYEAICPQQRVFVRSRTVGGWMGYATTRVYRDGALHGYTVLFDGGARLTCPDRAVHPAYDLAALFGLDALPERIDP